MLLKIMALVYKAPYITKEPVILLQRSLCHLWFHLHSLLFPMVWDQFVTQCHRRCDHSIIFRSTSHLQGPIEIHFPFRQAQRGCVTFLRFVVQLADDPNAMAPLRTVNGKFRAGNFTVIRHTPTLPGFLPCPQASSGFQLCSQGHLALFKGQDMCQCSLTSKLPFFSMRFL